MNEHSKSNNAFPWVSVHISCFNIGVPIAYAHILRSIPAIHLMNTLRGVLWQWVGKFLSKSIIVLSSSKFNSICSSNIQCKTLTLKWYSAIFWFLLIFHSILPTWASNSLELAGKFWDLLYLRSGCHTLNNLFLIITLSITLLLYSPLCVLQCLHTGYHTAIGCIMLTRDVIPWGDVRKRRKIWCPSVREIGTYILEIHISSSSRFVHLISLC